MLCHMHDDFNLKLNVPSSGKGKDRIFMNKYLQVILFGDIFIIILHFHSKQCEIHFSNEFWK